MKKIYFGTSTGDVGGMSDEGLIRRLKELAHGLKPMIRIGKGGVTDGVIVNIDRALADHELIKVRFLSHKDERRMLAVMIAEKTDSSLVDLIGNTAILYRMNRDPKRRRIDT